MVKASLFSSMALCSSSASRLVKRLRELLWATATRAAHIKCALITLRHIDIKEATFSIKGRLTHQVSECGFIMSHQVVYNRSPAKREREMWWTNVYNAVSQPQRKCTVHDVTHWLTHEESIWKNVWSMNKSKASFFQALRVYWYPLRLLSSCMHAR